MLICSFIAGNLSKFGLTFVIWLLSAFRRCFTPLPRINDSLIRGRLTSGVQRKLHRLAIAITVYWLPRNKLMFENYQFSVIEVISKIKFLMYRQAQIMSRLLLYHFGFNIIYIFFPRFFYGP